MDLPNCKSPCGSCPFRKDTMQGWLGKDRATEIANTDNFVCHKNLKLQCAGHLILAKEDNFYYSTAQSLGLDLELRNHHLICDTKEEFIDNHTPE